MSTDESDGLESFRTRIDGKERVMVYVDGMNLYYGILATGVPRYMWVDVCALSRSLLRADQVLVGVKYYVSRFISDGRAAGLVQCQGAHLDALVTFDDLEIIEGKFQGKTGVCRSCGHEWQSYEEKMTDVNIAIGLMTDAEDDIFDTALLVSGDGDLTGPIATVLSRHPDKRVVVAFPPRRRSDALRYTASAHFYIRQSRLRNCQLPDQLYAQNGYPLSRPADWR